MKEVNDFFEKIWKRIINSAINKFTNAKEKVISAINKFMSAMKKVNSAINKFMSAMKKVNSAINKFMSAMKKVISTINKFMSAMKKVISAFISVMIIPGTLLLLGVSAYIFWWGHEIKPFDSNYVVDADLLAAIGNFWGGVLGIVSVYFLYRTFQHQQKVTVENKKLMQSERFNNLFFNLLKLYEFQVEELGSYTETNKSKKSFFDDVKKNLQNEFKVPDNSKDKSDEPNNSVNFLKENIRNAIDNYKKFYIQNRSKMSVYFMTLYRIYELVDKSRLIDDAQKKEYLKIVRAQLKESELFVLFYNANTVMGESFREYINKYNLLKHIQMFDLLEFKKWWILMNEEQKQSINLIFYFIRQKLKNCKIEKGGEWSPLLDYCSGKEHYKYEIFTNKSDSEFSIKVIINKNIDKIPKEYEGLEVVEAEDINQFFETFLMFEFAYKNFNEFNNSKELKIEIPHQDDANTHIIKISSTKGKLYYLSHNDFE